MLVMPASFRAPMARLRQVAQAGSGMMRRQAWSSSRVTGRRELHDLGSRVCCAALPLSWQIVTNWTPRDCAEALRWQGLPPAVEPDQWLV